METILILGGTKEAATLAKGLVDDGHDVTTSLAGRTKEPAPLAGKTRIGGFGGVTGLAEWMRANSVTKLIDATHPFAEQISRNAVEAAVLAEIPLDVKTRMPWKQQDEDNWFVTSSLEESATSIPANARVLLALGSQHLAPFEHRDDIHFVIRMVDAPPEPLSFKDHTLLLGRPSPDWQSEVELLQSENITHIVCRNSGGDGAYAKVEAARHLEIPVIMLTRGA